MRFLIVGVGSIGQRHARNLRQLGHDVSVCDEDPSRAAALPPGLATPVLSVEHALDERPDAVLLCTPPAAHMDAARQIVDAGIHLFVEKPLAPSANDVAGLLADAQAKGVMVFVGANLRFFRSLRRLKGLIDEGALGRIWSVRAQCGFWMPFWNARDYRETYRARQATGGGILLDAIHEFDYLRWLFGEVDEVFSTAATVSGLEIDVEDLAEVTLRFRDGPLVQLHLDYLQRSYRRNCEVYGERSVAVWDYIRRELIVFAEHPDEWRGFRDPIDANHNEMYIEEMAHLVACLEGREAVPLIGATDGLRSLELVDAAKRSAAAIAWVKM